MERKVIEDVVFNVVDEANRFFAESGIDVRLLYIGQLHLEPGYLISLNTPEGTLRVYPLEAIIDVLHARLLGEIERGSNMKMNKIFALTTFPLVSRNPYFDFYERFLGIQETRLGLRIMVLSMKPFEPPGLTSLLNGNKGSREDAKKHLRLFKDRVLKGLLHEIGHGFGLGHCTNECVMNPPDSIEEWDSRPVGYCHSCFIDLKRAVEWSELSLGEGEREQG
ncbi:peptidase M54 [Thermococcus sp.]|nr:peptidase M54 [Thermococcus sp.]